VQHIARRKRRVTGFPWSLEAHNGGSRKELIVDLKKLGDDLRIIK
jgi:hypothetical protein